MGFIKHLKTNKKGNDIMKHINGIVSISLIFIAILAGGNIACTPKGNHIEEILVIALCAIGAIYSAYTCIKAEEKEGN